MTGTGRHGGTPMSWPALRRDSLSVRAAEILKRHILIEQLPPGHRLSSERQLAEWLNVSRMVLREAIVKLIGEGILYRKSPHALCVGEFDRARLAAETSGLDGVDVQFFELIELRVLLELGATDEIVRRCTDEHLSEIERWVLEGERRVATGETIQRVDVRFHAALLKALGNRAIDGIVPLIEENMRQSLVVDPHGANVFGTRDDARVVRQHREIYEAVKRRDVETARSWMLAHLTPYLQWGRERRETR